MPEGAAGVRLPGTGDLNEPVAYPYAAEKHREICTLLTFEIPADLLAFDSRNSLRAARATPDERPSKGRKCKVWIVCEVLSMLMEFGGTQG